MRRISFVVVAGLSCILTLRAFGQATPAAAPKVVAAASEKQVADMLGQIKALEGEWESVAEGSTDKGLITFKVTSGGSAVREIMLPGEAYEMTNMYHMDGQSLVVTHYCAAGNQPRMRAAAAAPGKIEFQFDSVTNVTKADESYMGGLTLIIKDKDHVRKEWRSIKDGKVVEHANFELTRKTK